MDAKIDPQGVNIASDFTDIYDPSMTSDTINVECGPPFWWIWLCHLRRQSELTFLYGCAAQSSRLPGWRCEQKVIPIAGGGDLVIDQQTVTDDVLTRFRTVLEAGTVDPSIVVPGLSLKAKIHAHRRLIQSGFGHTAARVDAHFTLPDIGTITRGTEGALGVILQNLSSQLNLRFEGPYAGRLGNFEIFHLNGWFDHPQPFLIEADVPADQAQRKGPRSLIISRTRDFAGEAHVAHVVMRTLGDVVIDRLIRLEPGIIRTPVDCDEVVDSFEFRLFDNTGQTLLHFESNSFFRKIDFTLSPVHRQITLIDDLSVRARQAGKYVASQASVILSHSSHRSRVQLDDEGLWRPFSEELIKLAEQNAANTTPDRWFPPSVESEVAIIGYFNSLLSGARIREATLVDPWFGVHALKRFALRLSSQDIRLTIVTSWTETNPDTGETLDSANKPTLALERALDEIAAYIAPRLVLINLADGKRQAFHDRYLVLYPHEDEPQVFLLSNSINRMAGSWPFCMSTVNGDARRSAQAYVEGLCDGKDVTGGTSPTMTLRWPPNAA